MTITIWFAVSVFFFSCGTVAIKVFDKLGELDKRTYHHDDISDYGKAWLLTIFGSLFWPLSIMLLIMYLVGKAFLEILDFIATQIVDLLKNRSES